MDELKRCPFCGSEETYPYHFKVGGGPVKLTDEYEVGCNGCGLCVMSEEGWKTEEQAIEAWNKRA